MQSYHRGQKCVEVIDPCQPKVCEFHCAVFGHQQVLWLEIPMDDAVAMQEVNAIQDLPHEILVGEKMKTHCRI